MQTNKAGTWGTWFERREAWVFFREVSVEVIFDSDGGSEGVDHTALGEGLSGLKVEQLRVSQVCVWWVRNSQEAAWPIVGVKG